MSLESKNKTTYYADKSLYSIDNDGAFRVANYIIAVTDDKGIFYASYDSIAGACWPSAKAATGKTRARKAIAELRRIGFLEVSERNNYASVKYRVMGSDAQIKHVGDAQIKHGGVLNLSTGGCSNQARGGAQSEHLLENVLDNNIKIEEETRARAQAAEPTPPQGKNGHKGSKGKKHPPATEEELRKLREATRGLRLTKNDLGLTLDEELQYGVGKHGVEVMLDLIDLIGHDPLMGARAEYRTIAYAVNTAPNLLHGQARQNQQAARAKARADAERAAQVNVVIPVMTEEDKAEIEAIKAAWAAKFKGVG